jgi:hypothetical protein
MLMQTIADKSTQAIRLEECKACPMLRFTFRTSLAFCSECRCLIRAKVAIQQTSCPLNKW